MDHLLDKGIVNPDDVISSGGEIVGSRSRLHQVLRKHGVAQPEKFLKEVTTRQAHPDGKRLFEDFDYGNFFSDVDVNTREIILHELIQQLKIQIDAWLSRKKLQTNFDQYLSPVEWITGILEQARGKSGGVVEQHLVGAKLQTRHPRIEIPNFPGHAADVQTGRAGDFIVGNIPYHVTVVPNQGLIQKCRENIQSGLHPLVLVSANQVLKAKTFAEYEGIERRMSVIAIEDFVALNIIEMANDSHSNAYETLFEVITLYNQRVEEVETDISLQFDL